MLQEAIRIAILSDKIPYLEGPPGCGKSAIAKVLGRTFDVPVFVVYLGHRAGNEIHGISVISREPLIVDGKPHTVVESAPPRVLVETIASLEKGKGAILFFDEINQVSPHDIGPVMAIFSEREWAGIKLPRKKIAIIAAGNPVSMSAGGWKFPLPVRRRVSRIPVKIDAAGFAAPSNFPSNWGFPLPPMDKFDSASLVDLRLHFRTILGAWVRGNQDCFEIRDIAKACDDGYVCPATLEDASDILARHKDEHGDAAQASLQVLLRGTIGHAAADSVLDFIHGLEDITDASEALRDPDAYIAKGEVPPIDKLYYFCMAIVGEQRRLTGSVSRKLATAAWAGAFKILGFLAKQNCAVDVLALAGAGLLQVGVRPPQAPPPPEIEGLAEPIRAVQASGTSIASLL